MADKVVDITGGDFNDSIQKKNNSPREQNK